MAVDWRIPRSGTYRYVRVDYSTRHELEELHTIQPKGSIARNMDSALKESGSLPCEGPIDIGDDLLRIYYVVEDDNGNDESVALATMHAAAESVKHTVAADTCALKLYSALLTLEEDCIDKTLTIAAGSIALDEAVNIIASAGLPVVAASSTRALTEDASWDAGTSKLTVINDLLAIAGFWSAGVDGWGRVVLSEYVEPIKRSIVWDFSAGANSITLPEATYDSDRYKTPNKAIVVCSKSGSAPIIGTATNTSAESPYSTVSRGRVITTTITVSDVADQAAADSLAAQTLESASSPSETAERSHTFAPVTIRDVVRVKHGYEASIQSQDITLSPACLISSSFKRIWR